MDFNKLVNTLRDIEPVNVFDPNGASKKALTESAAPAVAKVELSNEAQMRVLAGVSTILAESKKVKEAAALDTEKELDEVFDSNAKTGDKKDIATGTVTKTATGLKHEKKYGKDADAPADEKPAKKKVKEAAKPDFADLDKDGDKKEPMKKAAKEKKMKEAFDPEKMKDGDMHRGGAGGGDVSSKDKKKPKKAAESAMMPKGKKRPVKESVEQKLTFKDCIRLVRESGGQQQIDPLDKELFAWAQRVAKHKFNEGVQQDAFAGVTYERFGGRFALYDVLSESKK